LNSQQYPSTPTDAATSALMRSAGMLAATFGQSRLRALQDGELAELKATCEGLVGLLLQAVAGRDLDTGLDAVGLIARYGTAGLLLRLCRLPGDRVAKRLGVLLLTLQLIRHRAVIQVPPASGVFDLAFSAQNQRTFLGRLVYLTDQLAGLETEVEHMRRLDRAARRAGRARRFQVVELDRPLPNGGIRELADEVHDPQRSVPVLLDLERALAQLSPGEQVTFLRKLAGFAPMEIARRIGSTPQAVRVMQCRARITLRQLMGERRRAS
jgi:hypothetical protein